MKKAIFILSFLLLLAVCLLTVMTAAEQAVNRHLGSPAAVTPPAATAAPTQATTEVPTEAPTEAPTVPATRETLPPETVPTEPVLTFTEEERTLLLKLGMAERGDTYCTQCIALVMRTVLNRVESPRFPDTIKGVIYAEDQFTPVAEGTFETAKPNVPCEDALEMICRGWDESQGALYYEWCEGDSWHSRNLQLLTQHCDTRFYK